MNRALPIAAVLALAACTLGPDYVAPEVDAPAAWNDPSARDPGPPDQSNVTTVADPDPQWWKSFGDPELTSLVERAIQGNLPLQEAVLRIEEARQQEIQAEAAGLPHLSANASYMHEQEGLRGLVRETGGSFSSGTGSSSASGLLDQLFQPFNLFQDSLNATWEVDLFGRVQRASEEARANTLETVANHNDALVSLEAQVGQTYAQFRGAEAQLQVARENVKVEQSIVSLTQDRYKRGLSSYLDVDNAVTQLDTTTASLPQYIQQQQVAANALCLLLGLAPGALDKELSDTKTVPTLPPDIPIGFPSALAERRADVHAAAEQLHEATAELGVAIAETYPDLTLTGEAGTRALEVQDITHWADHFYAAGPEISLPVFEGGKYTAEIAMTTAEQQEAALNYRQTVLTGLNQVESALAAYRADRARQQSLAETVKAAEDGLYLARNRYQHGLSNFIDVLTTENQLVTARQEYVDSALAVTEDVVTLYRALGGGWQGQPNSKAPPPESDRIWEHLLEQ